jgi:hypothetical protein
MPSSCFLTANSSPGPHDGRALAPLLMVAGLALGLLICAPRELPAGDPLDAAVQVSWGAKTHAAVGGRMCWSQNPALVLGADYFFPQEQTGLATRRWDLSVNGVFHTRARTKAVRPYLGAGMSLVRMASRVTVVPWEVSDTSWRRGANILAGVDVRLRHRQSVFLETRAQIWGMRQLLVCAGLRYSLHD